MYGSLSIFCLCLFLFSFVFAPPPRRDEVKPPGHEPPHPDENDQQGMLNLSYQRYLMEVVKTLEKDEEFQKKLTSYGEDYIKSGKIADHVDELGPSIRDKLTQIKLKEIERLRDLVQKQIELDGGAHNIDFKQLDHVDHANVKSFEKDDLKKLITKTVGDLDDLDKTRKEEFKEYEMKKTANRHHKMGDLNEEERKKMEHEYEEAQKRREKHEPVHHPGSKDQLEEVWEESDNMDKDSFDPRTFFNFHDLDGNGFWDDTEIEALFQNELDKVYNDSNPDDDPKERIEEMNRMREHVVGQMDKNHDRLISLEEFMADTETDDFKKDEGWDTLEDDDLDGTDEEMQRFEEEYARRQGWQMPTQPLAPHGQQPVPQYPNQIHPQDPNQPPQHPNQPHVPPPHPNQPPPHPNQPPQHPNQVPNAHPQGNQLPQGAGQAAGQPKAEIVREADRTYGV